MSRIQNLRPDEQILVLKDILNNLGRLRAYIQGTGSEEYTRECETVHRSIQHVIRSIEGESE